jgi:hypothetical protein
MPGRPMRERPPRGGHQDATVDVVVVAKAFRRTQKMLERLANRLDEVSKEVDAVAAGLEDVDRRLSGIAAITPRRGARRSADALLMADAEAEAGASSLQIVRDASGRASVSVSGRRPLTLPPKLATLLAILATAGEEAETGLPGWQTSAQVAAALNEKTGGALSPAAVPRLVYKLREAFRDAGENSRLIQVDRDLGIRFAVRR